MTPERLNILHTAFHTAKLKGLHNKLLPAPQVFASELLGLLVRNSKLERKCHGKVIKDSCSQALPTHTHHDAALQKWAQVIQEEMTSPLDFNPIYPHNWSADSRDALLGTHHDSLLSQLTGFSVCHPIYNDHTMNLSMLSYQPSSVLRQLPFHVPIILRRIHGHQPLSILIAYPRLCCKLVTIPANEIAYAYPQSDLKEFIYHTQSSLGHSCTAPPEKTQSHMAVKPCLCHS